MQRYDNKPKESSHIVEIEIQGFRYDCELEKYINRCPSCDHAIIPKELGLDEFFDANRDEYKCCITYYCPNCFNAFIAQYTVPNKLDYGEINLIYFDFVGPLKHSKESFSETILQVSPEFVDLYNQAFTSEQMGLNGVAGPGYRKALEFLVKDFAIKNYPDKKEEIEKATLAQCINNYLDDAKMKKVVQAATWIGNDQTHYIQKHIDRNLDDLKAFIKVALSHIEYTERTNDAIKFTTK
ncbi:DUF4145 domain-containing protein [Bacillus thuringiensis]|uniref:DUF4145 domain-containing protein n=1 Tax=Bacillus thuringiensis TaxID=1428 RepID=UPI000BF44125|nr:DUF4145 domain-containing protein [Bacillus thuringiensis]MDA2116728.1 DUF4145 domain-containing protein [Bacillus cereus]MDA2133702.1 DUF4145 domain-containing protein [Bacillus cereus]PFS88257.1 hypothetical protein COK53_22910 [Bacillus thuringiensis]